MRSKKAATRSGRCLILRSPSFTFDNVGKLNNRLRANLLCIQGMTNMTIVRHQSNKILSQAVEHGGLVYVAGQVANDLTQGVRGQTEQILKQIDALLAAANSDKSRILSANIWLSDIRTRDDMNQAWTAWADPKNLPARATVEAKMAAPDVMVEIMVTAAQK